MNQFHLDFKEETKKILCELFKRNILDTKSEEK